VFERERGTRLQRVDNGKGGGDDLPRHVMIGDYQVDPKASAKFGLGNGIDAAVYRKDNPRPSSSNVCHSISGEALTFFKAPGNIIKRIIQPDYAEKIDKERH
jgi:hypothetical protein